MSTRKHLAIAVLALIVVVTAGGLLLVLPVYREAAAVNQDASRLKAKGEDYQAQTRLIDRLSEELKQAAHQMEHRLKHVPESPDVAGLMRTLSLPVDRDRVKDQTFSAGQPRKAVPDSEVSAMAVPLTVEMVARFDSLFAVIQSAESMSRLLRVTAVNIACENCDRAEQPFATASVVLEVIYDPPQKTKEDDA